MTNAQRLRDALSENRVDLALLTHFGRVAWVSGYAEFIEKGPDPFSGGPSVAVVSADDSALVVSGPPTTNHLERTVAYVAYDHQCPCDAPGNWRAAVLDVLRWMKAGAARIGYDADSIPGHLLEAIRAEFHRAQLTDVGPVVDALRARKTVEEVSLLRAACQLCDVGQRVARESARPGTTEIEIYSAIHAAMEKAASSRLPLGADVVSGERTLETGGHPGGRLIRAGDLLMIDIHPRHPDGYWGDSCATFVVGGEPTSDQRHVHQLIWDALQRGGDVLRPGVKAREVDAVVRDTLNAQGYDYPHHSGHGIGTSHFEQPLIMPWNNELLAKDMVITLEPGVYHPSTGGIRLEWAFRITAEGSEPLTQFDLRLAG